MAHNGRLGHALMKRANTGIAVAILSLGYIESEIPLGIIYPLLQHVYVKKNFNRRVNLKERRVKAMA
jgi:hypothetical protein